MIIINLNTMTTIQHHPLTPYLVEEQGGHRVEAIAKDDSLGLLHRARILLIRTLIGKLDHVDINAR